VQKKDNSKRGKRKKSKETEKLPLQSATFGFHDRKCHPQGIKNTGGASARGGKEKIHQGIPMFKGKWGQSGRMKKIAGDTS